MQFCLWDCRYALDVHTDRAEDVLTHKQLLEEAKVPENRPVFHVRAVQVRCSNSCTACGHMYVRNCNLHG